MNMIRGYITVPKDCKYGNSSDINNIYTIERERDVCNPYTYTLTVLEAFSYFQSFGIVNKL